MKKILALVLSVMMVLAMSVGAFAKTITITPPANITFDAAAAQAFKAYQIFTATPNGTLFTYTLNSAFEDFETEQSVLLNGLTLERYLRSIDGNAASVTALSEALHAYVVAKAIAPTGSGVLDGANVKFDLADGYYLIANGTPGTNDSGLITRYILDTTTDETIGMKADAPTIDKNIDPGTEDNLDDDVKEDNANIGDVIDYVLTSKVPDMTGYTDYTYIVRDTMSKGLTFNNDVDVTIGGSDYTVTVNPVTNPDTGITVITIDFGDNFINQTPGADIVVRYSATLNKEALTDDANTNSVELDYSNDPYDESDYETTPPKETEVFTFDFDLYKYGIDGNGINGVIFNLYKVVEGDEADDPILFANDGDGRGYYPSAAGNAALTTADGGKLYVRGLEAGVYHLKETNATALGYDEIVGDIVITIDEDGNVTVNNSHVNVGFGSLEDGISPTEADYGNSVTILNTVGGEFPSTGGSGTTMYTLGGLSMMAAAAVVLFIKKSKMSKANN